ncbi:MAG TPA: MrtC family glutamic-type intramembrane protease [Polyangiaceae bacterium]|nr:MrtC family glutamic-type intramembrane protease [Polyangiaceae bacterium]
MTPPGGLSGLSRALAVAALVTALATALSYLLPDNWAATGVGFVFLFATYRLVVRTDDVELIRRFGLSLGGLLEPTPLSAPRLLRSTLVALAHALAAALIIYPFFWLGFRIWWKVGDFHPAPLGPVFSDALGQLLVIALPEEAFYRGYLQTTLEHELDHGRGLSLFGTRIGWGIVLTSAIFALGHLLTELNPARLAVFFPSLAFGFLRARTKGIGAGVFFHALCNLFSAYLLHSYFG